MERLADMSLADVRVHYASPDPARINALAYARGHEIHLGPGQERHLPHEAWHIVQQARGRVAPTIRLPGGELINDDPGLEREASAMGARALERAATLPPTADASVTVPIRPGPTAFAAARVAQRAIGFEYETSVNTFDAAAALTDLERTTAAIPAGSNALNKGDVLVGGMGGLVAGADSGGTGLGSNLEFDTGHYPETPAGRGRLHATLKKLERFCRLIETERAAGVHHIRAAHLAAAFGGTAPHGLRYLQTVGGVSGNPQATIGVRVDKVEELMERTVGGPTVGPHPVPLGAPLSRLELGAQNLPDFTAVGNSPFFSRQGVANFLGPYAGPAFPVTFPSDELIGVCALMLTYMTKGAGGPLLYAKNIASIMARTDFGTIYASNVPHAERVLLGAPGVNGTVFADLFDEILAVAGLGGVAAPLFANSPVIPANDPAVAAAAPQTIPNMLSRQEWVDDISAGNDLLTVANFPLAPAQPHMFGLGEMGAFQEAVNPVAPVQAPIFELRRIRQNIAPHDFTEMAMGIYDYVVALNSAAAPGAGPYARAPRAAKQPKQNQLVRYNLSRFFRGG